MSYDFVALTLGCKLVSFTVNLFICGKAFDLIFATKAHGATRLHLGLGEDLSRDCYGYGGTVRGQYNRRNQPIDLTMS